MASITLEQRQSLVALYVGMFQAAPGTSNLSTMVQAYESGQTLKQIASTLDNADFRTQYPAFLTAQEFADRLISRLLGSEVGAAQTAWATNWVVNKLNSGVADTDMIVEAVNALRATANTNYDNAKASLSNKVEVAEYYSIEKAQDSSSLSTLQSVISGITSDAGTVTTAKSSLDESIANTVAQTYTLTNTQNQTTGGADNFTGTDGNDTFLAVASDSLDNGDVVNGAAGTDTLTARYNLTDPKTVNAAVTNVEVVNIDLDDGDTANNETLTFGVSGFTGLTNLNIVDGGSTAAQEDTVNFTGIPLGVALGLTRGDANYIADFDYSGAFGTADKATLSLDTARAHNVIIASIEEVTVNAANGSSTLDELNIAQATKLIVTGAGNLTVTDLDPATNTVLATVDASAATGNVSLTGFIAGNISVTGGTGNDTFNVSANGVGALDALVGGEGSDRLINDESMTTALPSMSGIETLEFQNTATADADFEISGLVSSDITTFVVDAEDDNDGGAGSTITISSLDSGDTIRVENANAENDGTDDVRITGTMATDGVEDTLTVELVGLGTIAAGASTGGVGLITMDQAETLNVVSNPNIFNTVKTNNVESLSAQAAKSIVITGSADIDVDAITNTSALTSIDASAATGKVTIDGLDASKLTFTAGSGDTTISLVGLNNEDTLKGGASTKDKVVATAVTSLTATTGKFAITDFETVELRVTGANTIDASSLSGVTELSISGATPGTQTITGLAAGVKVGLGDSTAVFDNSDTVNASLADASGSADTLTFAVDTTASANTDVDIKTANIETVSLAMSTVNGKNAEVTLANSTAANVVVTGGIAGADLTISTLNKATTSFDASGYTGGVIVSAANATAGATITVGKGEDGTNITGSALKDTITIGETDQAVTVNGGADVDTLNLSVKNGFADTSNISNVENINITVKTGEDVTVTNAGGFNNAATDNIVILGGNTLSTFTTGTLTATTIQTVNASSFGGNLVSVFGDDVLGTATTVTGGALVTDSVTANYNTGATYVIKTSAVETVDLKADTGGDSGETYTFDMTNATGISTLALRAGAATADDTTVNVTNLAAGTKVSLGSGSGEFFGSSTAAITLASNAGTSDALTLRLVDTDGTTDTTVVTAAGIETLNLEVAASAEVHSVNLAGVDATAGSKQTINMTGGQAGAAVTITSVDTTTNVIDASAFLGNLILSDRGTSAMTITGGIGADQLRLESSADVIDGGTGTDTLSIAFNAVLGGLEVDLSQSGDQVTTFNGSANSAVQTGFENVDVSGYAGSFGSQITAAATGSTITGTANADVINLGAGVDNVVYTAIADHDDIINSFNVGGTASDDNFDINFTLTSDDGTAVTAGNLAAANYLEVTAAAGDDVFQAAGPGDGADVIFEFENAAEVYSGNFSTMTAAELKTAIVGELDASTDNTTASTGEVIVILYDNQATANAVIAVLDFDGTNTGIVVGELSILGVATGVGLGNFEAGDFI